MFQINWKLKALLYKVFETFKLNKTLYFVQGIYNGQGKKSIHKTRPSLGKARKINTGKKL